MQKNIAVIGAGVIGLAIAYSLSEAGHKVTIFEKETKAAQHTSSHNSSIIHAGLYYKPGSLKAKFCMEGRQKIYDFCTVNGIRVDNIGKLIVATHEAQMEKLRWVHQNAKDIGATEVELLDAKQLAEIEPGVTGMAALLSPKTGIFDVKHFIQILIQKIEQNGGEILYSTKTGRIAKSGHQYKIQGQLFDGVINAAGLWAEQAARQIEGLPQDSIPKTYFAKGNYFKLAIPSPFNHLVYPIPMPGGLGIHVSYDFNDVARFGPDVEWLDDLPEQPDYTVDESRSESFRDAIATYYPAIEDMELKPDYAGIRPKLVPAGEPDADFIIQDCTEHDLPNLFNLYGFESPGLTGCLAIGEHILKQMKF